MANHKLEEREGLEFFWFYPILWGGSTLLATLVAAAFSDFRAITLFFSLLTNGSILFVFIVFMWAKDIHYEVEKMRDKKL
jgi:hypothetical protein